jgi:hypothetical protein
MATTTTQVGQVSSDASVIEFLAYYVRRAGNKTGSFVVHPDEVDRLTDWRNRHGVHTEQAEDRHPVTGQKLPAYRPVEGDLLKYVEEQAGIKPGQLCWVGYRIQHVAGQAQMRTLPERIRPA